MLQHLERRTFRNIKGVDLVNGNLQGADLRSTDLRYLRLRGVNFKNANLQGVTLQRADLQGASLRRANLADANLSNANLQGADLEDANLQGTNLQSANLRGANLRYTNLQDADLDGANLEGTDFRNALGLLPNNISPLQIAGSSDWVIVRQPGYITIGCYHKPIAWWEEHYVAVGNAEGYTANQIEEYRHYITFCREWMTFHGIDIPRH